MRKKEKNQLNFFWYRSYYPHRSRDLVSPVCGIFFTWLLSEYLLFYRPCLTSILLCPSVAGVCLPRAAQCTYSSYNFQCTNSLSNISIMAQQKTLCTQMPSKSKCVAAGRLKPGYSKESHTMQTNASILGNIYSSLAHSQILLIYYICQQSFWPPLPPSSLLEKVHSGSWLPPRSPRLWVGSNGMDNLRSIALQISV